MVKCNLKDLKIVSDEVARYAGFISQYDMYIFVLGSNPDLFCANLMLNRYENFYFRFLKYNNKNIPSHLASYSEIAIKKKYDFFKSLSEDVIKYYPEIMKEYPDFNDYIKEISDVPSPQFSD